MTALTIITITILIFMALFVAAWIVAELEKANNKMN